MKIIERGNFYTRRVTCAECKSVLEYGKKDLDYDIPKEIYFINCKVCGIAIPVQRFS